MLALLVFLQNFAGAFDHAARKASEPRYFDAVAFIGAARFDAAKKNNFVRRLFDRDVNVLHASEEIGKLGELMVVRSEKRASASVLLQVFDDGPGDGQPVKRRGAASHFIEQHKTRWRGVMQDGSDFAHLDEKRRAAARQIVARADARKNAVRNRQLGLPRWNERAHLRHQHDQRSLPKIRGLAAHVRAGDKQKLLSARVEAQIVRNEALAALAKKFFNDRMTAADNEQLAG